MTTFLLVLLAAGALTYVFQSRGRRPLSPEDLEKRWRKARALQQCFFIDLPESSRREPLTYEVDGTVDYLGFCESQGKSPLALYRGFQLDFARELLEKDPQYEELLSPGSPFWFLAILGWPWGSILEPQRRAVLFAEACPECKQTPTPAGSLPSPSGAVTEFYICLCGRGFGLWRPEPAATDDPMKPSTIVVSLRPGPRDGAFLCGLMVPARYEDPIPPIAFVFYKEKLIGWISHLRTKLFYTNDLSVEDHDPARMEKPLSQELFTELQAFLTEHKKLLCGEWAEMKEQLANEKNIWQVAGLTTPELSENPETEPLVIRRWGEGELADGQGRSPHRPIICHNPSGEQRFLRSMRCPDDAKFRFQRVGSMPGTCPAPRSHKQLIEVDHESPAVIVDKYKLQCECGDHSGFLYFDMYHPDLS